MFSMYTLLPITMHHLSGFGLTKKIGLVHLRYMLPYLCAMILPTSVCYYTELHNAITSYSRVLFLLMKAQ